MHSLSRCALFPAVLVCGLCLQASEAPRFRLGDSAAPERYQVELTLSPAEETFSGTVDIQVNLRQPQSTIWLNATNITVEQATVNAVAAQPVTEGTDFLGLKMDQPAGPGAARIHIAYTGHISHKSSDGLFLNKAGQDRYIFSQFEPTSARLAFPCFDEPGFKTPWQLTLHVPQNDQAFSNTPVLSETPGPAGIKTVVFRETRPLPSYLVALAVGPLEIVEAGKAGRNHIPVRIIAPRGRAEGARYAAQVSAEILTRLEDYFGIPYPYEKLDNVAMPLIYGFGAMENAGLITYAQTLILAKPGEESADFRRRYASVAAHEMAHQWFGDLVTLSWWNDVWLNEAFATWMEQKLVAEWKPEWQTRVSDVFATERAMRDDALVSARKIRQPVLSPDDIGNAFDSITYEKGAAVIRMFETWVRSENFRKGVQLYLKKHAFGNATSAEFLADVSQGAGQDIAPAFDTFLDQAGVPLLSVTLKCGAAPALAVTQKRYLPLGSPGNSEVLWQIPVCVSYGEGTHRGRACALVKQASQEVPLRSLQSLQTGACPSWVAANPEQGYYRVVYPTVLLDRLLAGQGEHLDLAERVGLLSDVSALVGGGELPGGAALKLVPEFSKDASRYVVEGTIDIVDNIGEHLAPDDLRPNFERFVRQAYGAWARELGWVPKPDEDDNTRLLRPRLLQVDARKGADKPLVEEARRLAERWLEDPRSLVPEMIAPVLNTAAQYGDRTLFDRFYAAAKKETEPRGRRRLLTAMGQFRDPAIAQAALNVLLSGEFDARESMELLLGPRRYPETRDLAFEFVKRHIDELEKILPRGVGADAAARLPMVAQSFCSAEKRAEVEQFFGPRIAQYTGGPRNLAQTLESIAVCSAEKKAQEPSVAEFLRAY
jgi:cytosol alanyl aminopeptidase